MAFEKIIQDAPKRPCISLIGMSGAGKSTLAPMIARALGWAHIDTDRHIEAYYGLPLQEIYDTYGHTQFLAIEEQLVSDLALNRMVISTGGSVIYGAAAMEKLKSLGTLVYLAVDETTFLQRVGSGEGRGIALAPGMTLQDLHKEREPLYAAAADITIRTDAASPEECVKAILNKVAAA